MTYVLSLFVSPAATSSALRFSSFTLLSLLPKKLGGLSPEGVGNVSGLGSTALPIPLLPQLSQSENRPPGDAIKDCSMYRLGGSALTGVSMLLFPLRFSVYALLFCEVGGGGLANGLGGPDTPADNSAEAEGEGGGRTMPLCCPRSGFAERLSDAPRGEPDPDSFSSDSEGICRFSLGREEPDFEPLVSLR